MTSLDLTILRLHLLAEVDIFSACDQKAHPSYEYLDGGWLISHNVAGRRKPTLRRMTSMSQGFDAYYQWLGIPPQEQPPNHYRLLSVELFEDNGTVIDNAAERQMTFIRSKQSGPNYEASQRLLNEIAAARFCLLNAAKKAAYDQQLRAALASPSPNAPAAAGTESKNNNTILLVSLLGGGAALALGVILLAVVIVFLSGDNEQVAAKPNPTVVADPSATDPSATGPVNNPPLDGPEVKPVSPQPMPEPVDDPPTEAPPIDKPPVDKPPTDNPPTGNPADPKPPTDPANPEASDGPKTGNNNNTPAVGGVAPAESQPEVADDRLPLPKQSELDEKRTTITEIFALDKSKTREEKATVAKKMLEVGGEIEDDLASQYMLFELARSVAAEAGDIETALSAVDKLDEIYRVVRSQLRMDTIVAAANANVPATLRTEAIREGVTHVDILLQADEYVAAAQLVGKLEESARDIRHTELISDLKERRELGRQLYTEYQAAKTALETVAKNPDDAEAALVAGKFFALSKGDWQTGLPLLAKGSDAPLGELAKTEMSVPTAVEAQKKLGDDWLKLSESLEGLSAERAKARASLWYGLAKARLQGLAKLEVERQLEKLGDISVSPGRQFGVEAGPGPVVVAGNVGNDNPPVEPGVALVNGKDTVDLLKKIDVRRNFENGDWQLKDGVLLSPVLDHARISVPVHPPKEYILEAEVTRLSGVGVFALGITYGDHQLAVEFDRPKDDRLHVGFVMDDDKVYGGWDTYAPLMILQRGRRAKITCVVREENARIYVDDIERGFMPPIIHGKVMSIPWQIRDAAALMIGADNSSFEIHSLNLTPIEEKFTNVAIPKGESVDLLAQVNLTQDRLAGDFQRVQGSLGMWRAAWLQIPIEPPAEYDLEMELYSHKGSNHFYLNLPVDGQPCTLSLSEYGKPMKSYMTIPGEGGSQQSLEGDVYPADQPTKLVCQVRRDLISVTFAGKEIFRKEGRGDRLLEASWKPPHPAAFAVRADRLHNGNALFIQSAKLTPVSGTTKSLRPLQATVPAGKDPLVDYATNRWSTAHWVNLRTQSESTGGIVDGWHFEDKTWVSPAEDSQLAIRVSNRYRELEFVVSVLRKDKVGEFRIIVPGYGVVVLDGGPENNVSGLELIGGKGFAENESTAKTTTPILQADKRVEVRCVFRKEGISVFCNDQEIIKWKGDPSKLTVPDGMPRFGVTNKGGITRVDGFLETAIVK